MRPRVFAAEDGVVIRARHLCMGFNEAAGIRRGRHGFDALCLTYFQASMRPRVFAAEDFHIA